MTIPALTPGQVHTYLIARGWVRLADEAMVSPELWAGYERGDAWVSIPRRTDLADYGRRLAEALETVASVEGRPTPAEQVALDVVSWALPCATCGAPGTGRANGRVECDACWRDTVASCP